MRIWGGEGTVVRDEDGDQGRSQTMQCLTSHGKEFECLPESNREPWKVISRRWLGHTGILERSFWFQREDGLQGTRKMLEACQ